MVKQVKHGMDFEYLKLYYCNIYMHMCNLAHLPPLVAIPPLSTPLANGAASGWLGRRWTTAALPSLRERRRGAGARRPRESTRSRGDGARQRLLTGHHEWLAR